MNIWFKLVQCECKRLFSHLNSGRKKHEECFRRQNLGTGLVDRAVKTMCNEAGVKGSGMNDVMTNHGLRSSMTALIIAAGHTDSRIILKMRHYYTKTLGRYHIRHWMQGRRQEKRLFQSSAHKSINSRNTCRKQKADRDVQETINYGCDIGREHEKVLTTKRRAT